MNQIHRVIFNHALGVYQCVGELAKAKGKTQAIKTLTLAVAVAMSGQAWATDYTSDTTIGASDLNNGTHTINNGATVSITPTYRLGYINDANLTINNGKLNAITGENLTLNIAHDTGTASTINVTGATSSIETSALNLGEKGNGTLNISNGAKVATTQNVELAKMGVANVTVSNGAKLDVGHQLLLANNVFGSPLDNPGTATLTIKDNSTVNVGWNVLLSSKPNSNAKIVIDNKSRLQTGDKYSISIGNENAHAEFSLNNESTLQANVRISKDTKFTADNKSIINAKEYFSSAGETTLNDSTLTTQDINLVNSRDYYQAIFTANKSTITAKEMHVVGYSLTKAINSKLTIDDNLLIYDNRGTNKDAIFISQNSNITTNKNYVLSGYMGKGILTLTDSSTLNTPTLGVGILASSNGQLTAQNSKINAGKFTLIGQETGSTGNISLDNSQLMSPTIAFGKGSATLTAQNQAHIETRQIAKNDTASDSTQLTLNKATVRLTQDQSELFKNFGTADKIEIGTGGATFSTDKTVQVADTARITGTGNLIKSGTGELALQVASKQWSGETHIDAGTLKLIGDYNMASSEVLGIALNGSTTTTGSDDKGQLVVTGNATLDGTLQVKAADVIKTAIAGGSFNDTWQNVVKANSVTGQFATVNVVDKNGTAISNSGIRADYQTDAVHLTTVPVSVGGGGGYVAAVNADAKPDLLSIAQVADSLNASTNLGMALNLGKAGLSNAQIAQGVAELSPAVGQAHSVLGNQHHQATAALAERPLSPETQLWSKAIAGQSQLDASAGGATGRRSHDKGIVVGMDTPVGSGRIGAALAYLNSDADSRGLASQNVDAHSVVGMVYGDYPVGDFALHGSLGVGRSHIESQRHISTLTAGNPQTARADYDAQTVSANVELRRPIATENGSITPFVGLNYTQTTTEAHQETGAGVYNLANGKTRHENVSPTLGVRLNQTLSPQWSLSGSLAGTWHTGDRRVVSHAQFVGTPNTAFASSSPALGKASVQADVGVAYQPSAQTQLRLGYQSQWRGQQRQQGASVDLNVKF